MKFLKSFIQISLVTFFWLFVFEVGARIWIQWHRDALDSTRDVLMADSSLGWRQKPNLDTEFLGHPLVTNPMGFRSPPVDFENKKNIFVLGPSSSFGWGVDRQSTYPDLLQGKLNSSPDLKSYRVYNWGEIGFSSWQGMKLMQQKIESENLFSPDIIIVAYGINDLDNTRFYFQSSESDKDEFAEEKSLSSVHALNFINSFSLPSLLFRLAHKIRSSHFCENLKEPPVQRVSFTSIKNNLAKIAEVARGLGAQVVLLNTVYYVPQVQPSSPARLDLEHLFDQGEYQALIELAEKDIESLSSEDLYLLSSAKAHLAMCGSARDIFDRARKEEAGRVLRDVARLNQHLAELAEAQGVRMIDLQSLILDSTDQKALFVDPVHFSRQGNQLIAQAIYQMILDEKMWDQNED